ncbi:MAG TPA: hypothetical protein VF517_03625, partial [Thermoleophilaceae bacterium]
MELGALQQQPAGAAAAPRLRPLDVGQKLDAAIKLATRNLGTLTAIVLIVLVPINLLSFLITVSTLPDDFTAGGQLGPGATPDAGADSSGTFVAGQLVVNLLAFVAFFLVPAVCFQAIGQAYLGERTGWRESLVYGLRRLHSILWIVLLMGLALLLVFIAGVFFIGVAFLFPLLLLVVIPLALAPFVYLGVSWSLALPALLLEGARGVKALGRSHSLVQGRWWRTFGLLVLAWLLVLFVTTVVAGALAGVTYVVSDENTVTAVGLNFLANLVASVLTTPFLATVTIVLYFDLRVRKEAFDLQLLAGAIGGRAPSEALARKELPWEAPPHGAPPPPGWAPPPHGAPPPQAWAPPPGSAPPHGAPPAGWGHAPSLAPPLPPQGGWPPQLQAPQGWGGPPQGGPAPTHAPPLPQAPPPHAPPPPPTPWAPPARQWD